MSTKPIETWCAEKETADWLFAATKAALRWGAGKEVTEEEYEKAVTATAGIKFYAYPADAIRAAAEAKAAAAPETAPLVIDDRPTKKTK